MRLVLHELSHHQSPISIHFDNAAAAGISNRNVRIQCSQTMEMRYFYICYLFKNNDVQVLWHPGQENIGDYASKHHYAKHHQNVRPIYLHKVHSPRIIPRASNPIFLQGFVGNIPAGCVCGRPLRCTEEPRCKFHRPEHSINMSNSTYPHKA